jgi:hypothetical protein
MLTRLTSNTGPAERAVRSAVARSGRSRHRGRGAGRGEGTGGKQPRQSRDVPVLPDGAGPAGVAARSTRGTGVYAALRHAGSNLADEGWMRCVPAGHSAGGELSGRFISVARRGHGEVLRGSRGEAARAWPGSYSDYSDDRTASEHGNRPSIRRTHRGATAAASAIGGARRRRGRRALTGRPRQTGPETLGHDRWLRNPPGSPGLPPWRS